MHLTKYDMQELKKLVDGSLEGTDTLPQRKPYKPLLQELRELKLGDSLTWPLGSINESSVRATAAIAKRETGHDFTCRKEKITNKYIVKRIA